jgi:hypothetical protein
MKAKRAFSKARFCGPYVGDFKYGKHQLLKYKAGRDS